MSEGRGRTLQALDQKPVAVLRSVGPKKADALARMGIHSVLDLVTHYPRRHIDRTRKAALAEMELGDEATVLARVRRVVPRRIRGGRTLVEATVTDGTAYVTCSFFNQPWRAKQLSAGQEVFLNGRLEMFRGRRRMTNPVVDLIGDRTGRIVPVYPQSDRAGLSTWEIGGWVKEALERAGQFADPLDAGLREQLGLTDRTTAFNQIHFPASLKEVQVARRRLAFDELLRLQVALVVRRNARKRRLTGISHDLGGGGKTTLVERFMASLPFDLTAAQARAIEEILGDLGRPWPMHRLLQGDVGSGKTVVALAALLVAVHGGHQGALMAPTEVLAEQHHMAIRELLRDLRVPDPATLTGERPVCAALLTSRTPGTERDKLQASLAAGEVDLLIGTHALLTQDVEFASLGVVVVDEQHRFGVEQRATLRAKGPGSGGFEPDTLVMTATPIPRTAAMTVFGDLDTTVIDELPTGRRPVKTVWARGPLEEAAAWGRVLEQVGSGHQAYVVCPLVEESERIQARSATDEFENLREGKLKGTSVDLLHGQMTSREKEAVMASFRSGRTSVLVATSVIEVGVDVPNATVMVIEDADRFGIAQLHQLRGRVGRGAAESWCYLLGSSSGDAGARLDALEATASGFELAEVDLELRGEGTILGTRQKGRSDLKLASLRRDKALVELARSVAEDLVESDADLACNPLLRDEVRYTVGEEDEDFLFKS